MINQDRIRQFFFLNKLSKIYLKNNKTAPQAQGVLEETVRSLRTKQSGYQQPKKPKKLQHILKTT